MRALSTAGERVVVECSLPWLMSLLTDSTGGELAEAALDDGTVRVAIQPSREAFTHDGWTLIGRGCWASPASALIVDACSSGFDLLVEPRGETLNVTARYRPAARTRAANTFIRTRFKLLAAQTLLHYPALWWASVRGRVPLHVSVTAAAGSVTMIAGPGGVGKSTLLSIGLEHGEIATADNICACDGRIAHGLAEPLRVSAGAGARLGTTTHGRTEHQLPGRVPSLDPDRVVVLRRGVPDAASSVGPLTSADAARTLVAGTYMAGELRRFWPFAATLALATGIGPAHPDVSGVAAALAARLPCLEMSIAHGSRRSVAELLRPVGAL
jgi:hypothetical protein